MLGAVTLAHPYSCGAAATAHEEDATVAGHRRLHIVVRAAEETHRCARGAAIADRDLPDVEAAGTIRREDERLAIGGPRRLAIPSGTACHPPPLRVRRDDPQVAANGEREAAVRRIRRIPRTRDRRPLHLRSRGEQWDGEEQGDRAHLQGELHLAEAGSSGKARTDATRALPSSTERRICSRCAE